MAAGDGNRVWFPEMIETLRSRWNAAMPFPVLIELSNILDGIRMVHERGFWLEVVTLVIPGFNDDLGELRDLARFLESQPFLFAVFTNDDVWRAAGAAEPGAIQRTGMREPPNKP